MTVTIRIVDNQSIRISDEVLEERPPDRVAFSVEGVVTMTEEVLSEFEGQALKPIRIDVSVEKSRAVELDLTEASLRLETVDVGVEVPDADDLSPSMDSLGPSSGGDAESSYAGPGAIAFTVEGAIDDVPAEALEPIAESAPTLESITFTVDDAVKSDGGSDDRIFEFSLLGFHVVVNRNGVIEIGARGGGAASN